MAVGPGLIPGVLLAGGLSRRMGGGDKGLRELSGKPLMLHALERLSRQASPVAINANGDASRFVAFGVPVIADATPDHAGPLAGVLAAMRWALEASPRPRFVITAACDTPFFPGDLAAQLLAAAGDTYPVIALAKSFAQVHPVFGLWPTLLADDLAEALSSGLRKVSDWVEWHPHVIVDFPPVRLGHALVDPFFNANTPADLAEAERLLTQTAPLY